MKVSTKLFNEQQIRQFSSLNKDIQKLQDKISSGKNIVSFYRLFSFAEFI